ncbi:MAG: hypothetical protein AB1705_12155 [Verrucomicrobiota bacterium]
MSYWSFGASVPVVLLGVAVWLATAALCHVNWRRRAGVRGAGAMEALRLVIVTLLVFTLLRPEYVRRIERTEPPEVFILNDLSGSMTTKDIVLTNSLVARADWLARQKQTRFWQPLEKSGRVVLEDFAAPRANPPAPDDGTDLNDALEAVLKRQKNLKAVLVLSDGDWNQGKSPLAAATRFREQEIPVFTVAVGRDAPLPDLSLERIAAPSYGLVGEQVAIPFKVKNHLPREVKTAVALVDSNGDETKREITLPAHGELQDAIVWSPTLIGEFTLNLKLPVEPEEQLKENNEQQLRIAVRSETLKVLVVDSLPRWEYRFLRNALERDPGVEMHCLLYHPGIGMGGGRNYLSAFPGTKEALSQYDVIFLGDVGIGDGELKASDAELIKGLVEQQASGLVFLPGRQGRQLTLARSALKDLIPVQLDESRPEGLPSQNESTLVLSTTGAGHLLTRFDTDEARNMSIWTGLPGFYWSAAVEKSRPGSEVLAVHSSMRNSWGRLPLLVTRPHGNGKVLFMGTDSAWRWRRGVEDKYHYRFWSQVVRWMAHQRHLSERQGIRLTFSPESPNVGDTLFLQATVFDSSGFPIDKGPVTGKVTSPSGRTERLEFTPVEGGWGLFKSSHVPTQGGEYRVAVASEQHGRELDTHITVNQPVREKLGQPANAQILREIAGLTRGASGAIQDLHSIVSQISVLPEPKPLEKRLRLWAEPWWGALILCLLSAYWVARKMAGQI